MRKCITFLILWKLHEISLGSLFSLVYSHLFCFPLKMTSVFRTQIRIRHNLLPGSFPQYTLSGFNVLLQISSIHPAYPLIMELTALYCCFLIYLSVSFIRECSTGIKNKGFRVKRLGAKSPIHHFTICDFERFNLSLPFFTCKMT